MTSLNVFRLLHTENKARAGELTTPHGIVATPVFLPVASQGTVKTLTPDEVKGIGLSMVLSNTYHLYLRPGIPVIERMGGLHKFMGWDGAILTDSGGYQIFSLAALRRVSDEGVVFRSHIDGSEHTITPELAIQLQESLGADIIMVLDECPPVDSFVKVQEAMERTHRWAERCLQARKRRDQSLYAIVQGGVFPELRRQSAQHLTSLDFPGYAIGGLSLGEPKKVTLAMIEETVALLPENKPRYLMGVGAPEDIFEGVARGIDIFDSALPTRVARNGALFTRSGRINIRNAAFDQMEKPIDSDCDCYTCRTFSAAYLH
ncbi:MAG: tRNA guanosine(34) transglycosylase Tgt, partial [Chloroflexi bacterium]|nr:tRNA guanosine(34) transglycosylase Tgt [Chloroflexota bacterium]